MESLRQALKPLLEWLPAGVRDLAPPEVWGLLILTLLLALLLGLAFGLRALGRALFGKKAEAIDWEEGLREDLDECPMPMRTATSSVILVHNLPARLRLVIVAPLGKEERVPEKGVPRLLNLAIPGLGDIIRQDEPRLKVWPGQLSALGFAVLFQRSTQKAEPEGDPSHWVMLAGKVMIGKQALLLGMALWTDKPSTLGRIVVEPRQWLDVLSFRTPGAV